MHSSSPEVDEATDIVLAEAVRRYVTKDRLPPGGEDQLKQFDVQNILAAFKLVPLDGDPDAILGRLLDRDLATIDISEADIAADDGCFFLAPAGIERGLALLGRLVPAAPSADPNDRDMEELILRYFINDDRATRGAQPFGAIFKQIGRPARGWLGAFFDELRTPEEKRALLVILDRLVRRRLVQRRQRDDAEEPSFEANDRAIHKYFQQQSAGRGRQGVEDRGDAVDQRDGVDTSNQSTDALNHFPALSDDGLRPSEPIRVDSRTWTGLTRVRVTHRNARAISRLIDTALCELPTDGNAATAQARTLLLAAKELTDAPEPPSDIIWELVQRAGAVVGLLDIFFRIFTAVAVASLAGPS
ncbi:hypothetical protein MB02_05215 [Croceicoccus estronivorus]|uniref:hypothetical protein n=1 Tax=Croceicoccus estronivorus TaxID=1172626 RepID=UPI0008339611|nr:hypothetical protein [Croceicoccus estronivorus]OCC24860.1 hypothetical protein MB02_05215 [Croceicoccus estronivorus]